MTVAAYDVTLVRRIPASSGPPTVAEVGPIKWTGLTVTRDVGAPGQLNVGCTVDSLDSAARAVLLDLSVTPCELWVYRDGVKVHAGPLTNYQIQSRSMSMASPGLLAYLGYMVNTVGYTTAAGDQATIVKDLIDLHQSLSYGHFGLDTTHLAATGVTRELSLKPSDLAHVDEVVATMGKRENGFDLAVDPATRRLEMYSPRAGSDLSASVIIDARSIGEPNYSQSVGPGQIASEVGVVSNSGAGVTLTSGAGNATLRQTFGRSLMSQSFQDISQQVTLDDHATRALVDVDQPIHGLEPGLRAVSGFEYDDFGPGDIVTYEYDAGLGLQTFTPRVKSVAVSLDKGTERYAVTFF